MTSFRKLKTRNDLADFLKISRRFLSYILFKKKIENCYRTFTIPKKSGGVREISAPDNQLYSIQEKLSKAIADNFNNTLNTQTIAHGFIKGKSIFTNASAHTQKRYIINVDIKDFFPSINFGRVRGFFLKNDKFLLPNIVATTIAQLTCYKGVLPQGAPTSPIISNLICSILDNRILKLAKKYHLYYTRYADDLTFSTNSNFNTDKDNFLEELEEEIEKSGFTINKEKTHVFMNNNRQSVTGLTVNKKANVPSKYFRSTKAMAYNLYKNNCFYINGIEGKIQQLEGRFNYIYQINILTNRTQTNVSKKTKKEPLNLREREFAKFLYYKNFYANSAPLIITEGKTDIKHIKSALKNLYQNYPSLIKKNANDNFEFKIKFLIRENSHIKYNKYARLFNFNEKGADTFETLLNICTDTKPDSKDKFNYYNYFKKFSSPTNPVILLLDNENEKGKPIRKLFNYMNLDETTKKLICEKEYFIKYNSTNFYIQTIPLVNGKKTTEIEDLFDDKTLNIQINGKKFVRKDKDTKTEFGKERFAEYISANYKDINFSGFKPLFDTLQNIISNFKK